MAAKINLLPWRAQQRQRERKRFIISLSVCALIVILIVFCTKYVLGMQLNHQVARNQLLKNAISVLDIQLKEIKNLRQQRDLLISRITLIHGLQTTSILVVHLFDELIKTIPQDIYLTQMTAEKNNISVTGHTKSNRYISKFMRRIEHNHWLHHSVLREIRRTATDNEFKLAFLFRPESQRPIKL